MPDIADVRALSLEDGRLFPTKVAGLFLFLPLLLDLDLPQAVTDAQRNPVSVHLFGQER